MRTVKIEATGPTLSDINKSVETAMVFIAEGCEEGFLEQSYGTVRFSIVDPDNPVEDEAAPACPIEFDYGPRKPY